MSVRGWSELLTSGFSREHTRFRSSEPHLEFSANVSNPAQKRWASTCHGRSCGRCSSFGAASPGTRSQPGNGGEFEGRQMESDLRRLVSRFRRRMASIADWLGKLRAVFTPQVKEVRSQMMCPFCGLITPRSRRTCLECGKALRGLPVERKSAKQHG